MLNSKLVYQHSPERVNKVLEIHTGNLFVEINDKSCVIHTTVYTTTFSIYLSIYLHHNIYYISLFSLFYIFLYLSCKICCMNCCTNNISLMILYSHFKLQAKAMKFHWQKEEQQGIHLSISFVFFFFINNMYFLLEEGNIYKEK